MLVIIIFLLIFLLLFKFYQSKIHIDVKSFFLNGFDKVDNKFGLFCYCGKQGKGKTYSCVKFLIEQKKKHDYQIITNVKSFNAFEDTLYMSDIRDIISYCEQFEGNEKNIIIFFDEIFSILEKKTSISKEILLFISQLRKRKIIFLTTAQEWSEINITFRRYCRYQIDCNMFSLFGRAFIFNSINDGDLIKWDNDLQEFIAPRISANFAKCNKFVIDSYNTFETIQTP